MPKISVIIPVYNTEKYLFLLFFIFIILIEMFISKWYNKLNKYEVSYGYL